MTCNEMTFGIELETIISRDACADNDLRIGSYHCGERVSYLPLGWTAQRDGSLCGRADEVGCEIVSPVLQGRDGLDEVLSVVDTLSERGHRVNRTCGVHVHVGYKGHTREELERLVQTVSHLQAALYASTGTKVRENGRFCKQIRVYGSAANSLSYQSDDRYHILNLTNLPEFNGSKGTVEFRAFSGSLKPVKIAAWIQASLGIVEKSVSLTRKPTWNPGVPKGGMARKSGNGAGEIERLIHALQWREDIRERSGRDAYGWLGSSRFTEEQIRVELRRLGGKYDESEVVAC